jgi:hypothetical protein
MAPITNGFELGPVRLGFARHKRVVGKLPLSCPMRGRPGTHGAHGFVWCEYLGLDNHFTAPLVQGVDSRLKLVPLFCSLLRLICAACNSARCDVFEAQQGARVKIRFFFLERHRSRPFSE